MIESAQFVLAVEDESTVLALVAQALRAAGYHVVTAGDGVAALRIALENPQRLQMLISGVMIPGLDGLGLAREVRRVRPDIPVLLMTAYNVALESCDASPFPCITKPFTAEQLLVAVRAMLG